MFSEKDLLPAGRGVNREEKAVCNAFLRSRLFGSAAIRRLICEFVLTTKKLMMAPPDDKADVRRAAVTQQLLGKQISNGSYVFNQLLEGIQLSCTDGSCIVLSGTDGVHDRPTTVMWVRPSLAALAGLRVSKVRWMVLVNPFTTDADAEPNVYGRHSVEKELEVVCLGNTCGEVWIGGRAGCGASCGEGCSIEPIPLRVFNFHEFHSRPQVVSFIDRLNLRIVDEFGSGIFATESELCQLFARYPLDESCAEEMRYLLSKLFREFRKPKPVPDHVVLAVWVGNSSEELPGRVVDSDFWRAVFHARAGRSDTPLVVREVQFAECQMSTPMVTCSGPGCTWLMLFNPTVDELVAILKFASVCSVSMLAACVMVCMLDVDAHLRQEFVQALHSRPRRALELLFECSDALFGRQSCTVGVGAQHLKFGPERYANSGCKDNSSASVELLVNSEDKQSIRRDAEDSDGGRNTDDSSRTDASSDAAVFQEVEAEFEEPVAVITPDESARIQDELWASGVELRLVAPPSASQPHKRLRLLTFGRHPEGMDAAILASSLARRLVAEGIDVQPSWANGAKVLVSGVALGDVDLELCPRHIVCADGDEELVLDALQTLPYNQRPRLKVGAGQPKLPSESSLMQDMTKMSSTSTWMSEHSLATSANLGDVTDLPVRDTFIHFMPLPGISPRTMRTV